MISADSLCCFCRSTLACGLLDDELVCFGCLEELVERENAIAIRPELREVLPAIRVSTPVRTLRRPLSREEEREGREKAAALRRGLERFVEEHPDEAARYGLS